MKQNVTRGLLLVVMLLAACAPALAPGAGPSDDQLTDVRARIAKLVKKEQLPSLAVAVAREGAIIWQEGFGLADPAGDRAATEHTPYPLASISKPLTATALMILVERGLVDLDRPIGDYLEGVELEARVGDAAGVTVRRLASHTAGLPLHSRYRCDDAGPSLPSREETIRRYGYLASAPGERFQYANLGYGLLEMLIAQVTGGAYADFMQQEVFAPLGMAHSGLAGLVDQQAVSYTPDGTPLNHCEFDSPGAAALVASAHDLIRFAIFQLGGELPDQQAILSPAGIELMQQPNPATGPMRPWERAGSGYGIGWFIGVTEDDLRVVHHSGGTVGISTVLLLVPQEDLAVVVLSNTDGPWPDAIAIEILQALLPGQLEVAEDPVQPAGDDSPPPELVGFWQGLVHTYQGEMALVLEIRPSTGVLAQLGSGPFERLHDASYQDAFPLLLNYGSEPYLRGWLTGDLGTDDVNQGRPYKLWLEVKRRQDQLSGSLVALSQAEIPAGPLSHWVMLERE